MESQNPSDQSKPQDPGGSKVSPRKGITPMTSREPTFKGKVPRENTKTEVQTLGMGQKTATLYLSRTHTNMRGRNSSVASRLPPMDTTMPSRQPTHLTEEDELIAVIGLKKVQREFTFTGYDIMEDNAPREDLTPDGIDKHERLKRNYVKTYVESCKKVGVNPVEPISGSLADTHIVLNTRGLGVKGAKAIAIALVNNKTVESLDLEDNWIGEDGATSIAQMLETNHVLTEINIAENRIGTKGIRAIAELLNTNETIRKLDVSGSNLFDHDARYIAMILENNYKLRELRVRHNKFGELGGQYLGPAIANNDTLELLDLAWNHLRNKGAMAVAAGLHTNGGLRILDLSWNGFARDSCKILGMSLKDNSTLKELDISNNRVDAEATGGILKGIQVNDTLSTLKIGHNPITPDIATVILKVIACAERSDIRDLDLENIVVEEEFMKLLEETKQKRFMVCKVGLVIKKGTTLVKEGDKISAFMDPVQALYEYMNGKAYRVIDLFKRFDADHSMSVTRDEFCKGLISASVPLTVGQLEDLMEILDTNKDGVVDLKELIDGEKLFRRKMMRRKLRRQSEEISGRRLRSDRSQEEEQYEHWTEAERTRLC
ncbi:leucine-rich repeat-containing protein 74A-like [Littorina saxatilis]|uniref:EF-hand domain-containing protein n=1 Tax=Littorina saxatilis TaxID=31220 RepID=A0AAN9B5E8_9CAEN